MSRFRGHHSPPTRRRTTVKFAIALAAALILVVGGYLVGEWLENRSYQEERQQMSENFDLLPTMEYQGQTDVTGPAAPVNEVTLELGGGDAPVSYAAEVSEAAAPIAETAAMSQAIDMDALKRRVKAELVAHLDEGLYVATGKVYDALL